MLMWRLKAIPDLHDIIGLSYQRLWPTAKIDSGPLDKKWIHHEPKVKYLTLSDTRG